MCACPYSNQDSQCDDNPAMVLSVDYTNVALTILTFRNYYEWHDGGMVFAIEATTDRDDVDGKFWRSVMDALKSMVAEAENNRIDRIVLSGTLANDSNLHHAILWSLGDGYASPFRSASEKSPLQLDALDVPMADPDIAAAQGVADLAWRSTRRGCMDPCSQRQRLGLPLCLWEVETKFDPLGFLIEEALSNNQLL